MAYINGARAEPSVRTISNPNNSKKKMMGPSHHFFLTFKNSHSSANIDNLLIVFLLTFNASECESGN